MSTLQKSKMKPEGCEERVQYPWLPINYHHKIFRHIPMFARRVMQPSGRRISKEHDGWLSNHELMHHPVIITVANKNGFTKLMWPSSIKTSLFPSPLEHAGSLLFPIWQFPISLFKKSLIFGFSLAWRNSCYPWVWGLLLVIIDLFLCLYPFHYFVVVNSKWQNKMGGFPSPPQLQWPMTGWLQSLPVPPLCTSPSFSESTIVVIGLKCAQRHLFQGLLWRLPGMIKKHPLFKECRQSCF